MKKLFIAAVAALSVFACSKAEDAYEYGGVKEPDGHAADYASHGEAYEPGGDSGQGGGQSGILTAAEWNDLSNWDFWGRLMADDTYGPMAAKWGFNTSMRFAVKVSDASGAPVVNAPLDLYRDGKLVWSTYTNNVGEASLWDQVLVPSSQATTGASYSLRIASVEQAAAPVMTGWVCPDGATVNEYVVSRVAAPEAKADIAFIVDATGSMGDEIDFLKEDLLDILNHVAQSQSGLSLRTAAVFYRDRGDDYVTIHSDFTGNVSSTISFVGKQYAAGGGDLPEAVHSALECSLQNLSWNTKARSRIAFLVLDAPAHQDETGVIESLQRSIRTFASMGIRMIPVLASTGDKTTEFMCRDFAILTNGTYVFLTDDSGVGGSHLTPSVGQYQVEKLNELLERLIEEYIR